MLVYISRQQLFASTASDTAAIPLNFCLMFAYYYISSSELTTITLQLGNKLINKALAFMRNSIFENFRDRHIFVLRRNYGESLDTLSTL